MLDFIDYLWDAALGVVLGLAGYMTWMEFRGKPEEEEEDEELFHD